MVIDRYYLQLAIRGRKDLVEQLQATWQGHELPKEDESLTMKQAVISEIELARLKRGGLSS
jgi:hypothetical protein